MKSNDSETMTHEQLVLEHKILENFVRNIAYTHRSNQYFQRGTAKVMAQATMDRINHIRKNSSI